MRTTLTAEDIKNIADNIFNGNLWLSNASNGDIAYDNPNSEQIVMRNADTGETWEEDLAKYLNIKFYTWKERVLSKEASGYDNPTPTLFEDWLQSLNMSMNESYALVEKIDEEVVVSQDIDSSNITNKITFLVQADKVKNLDYYICKLRNAYMGVPQDLENAYGNKLKAYILIGALSYDQEPSTIQFGECVIVSCYFQVNYLNDALSFSDTQIEISLTGDDTYDESGNIVGDTHYLTMPITKLSWQNIFTTQALPTIERPDLTGFVASSLSNVKTLTFYDFNKQLTLAFNDLFWSCAAYRVDGILSQVKDVNVPVFIRVTSNGKSYVFKDVIDQMQKSMTNNDFNICSITLKGWGKIEQQGV